MNDNHLFGKISTSIINSIVALVYGTFFGFLVLYYQGYIAYNAIYGHIGFTIFHLIILIISLIITLFEKSFTDNIQLLKSIISVGVTSLLMYYLIAILFNLIHT